jgi:hypothetical protein
MFNPPPSELSQGAQRREEEPAVGRGRGRERSQRWDRPAMPPRPLRAGHREGARADGMRAADQVKIPSLVFG